MANVKEYSVEEKLVFTGSLQKIESKMDEIQILKGELPMEVVTLKMKFGFACQANTYRRGDQRNHRNLSIRRKNAIKEAEALIKKYEKQSENVKNNREFEAINKEIEMQQLEVKLAEKHIKDANEEIAEKVVCWKRQKNDQLQKKACLKQKR